ncbi:hypothetical protein [Microbacterium sp. A93]|uniref:hypothetical protein n=1 Tax=Microbacterium sp. A93 TaxID=3450716 RepID=UPI003F41B63E
MAQALRTFLRILAQHWPALVAWCLGGEALHQLLVQLAGFVGGHTTLGGLLLLPLAVAVRLISYVAMYLAVRPSLANAVSPSAHGYREFAGAMLPAILPFSAFYAAQGLLSTDLSEFFNIAAAVALPESGYDLDQLGDRGGLVSVSALPVAVLVIALVVRFVLSRLGGRLPTWTLAIAAYVEVLWTFMLFTLVGQWWSEVRAWMSERVVAGWLNDSGDWVAANIAPVASLWEGALWLFGIAVAALIIPAAWLAVAGVIYGTTFEQAPVPRRLSALQGSRAALLSRILAYRFEHLWAAVAVVWRGGPALFGAFAVAYAAWSLAERLGTRGILYLFGGHETPFWTAFLPLILVGVSAIAEPLRVAIVATAYDSVISQPEAGLETQPSPLDHEARDGVVTTGDVTAVDVESEGAGGILWQKEDRHDVVGE